MDAFTERLNELLADRELKPDKLANDIGVSVQTIYSWKGGNQKIFLSNLVALCNYLKCSIDFLAGRSDTELDFIPQSPPPFNKAIRDMMTKRNVTTYRLRKDTRYDGSYFARWDRGAEPYLTTLIELASYFDCSIDELIGREN